MLIQNQSKVPTKRLKPLLSFVLKRIKHGALGSLSLKDAQYRQEGWRTYGRTWKVSPEEYPGRCPSLIEIFFGTVAKYPFTDQYKPYTPSVKICSWEEEVLLVLAHEARHLDQYWAPGKLAPLPDRELDAELFAIQTVDQWRTRHAT